jgi:hypothetical protein
MPMRHDTITICAKSLPTYRSARGSPSLNSSIDATEQPLPMYKSKPLCGFLSPLKRPVRKETKTENGTSRRQSSFVVSLVANFVDKASDNVRDKETEESR